MGFFNFLSQHFSSGAFIIRWRILVKFTDARGRLFSGASDFWYAPIFGRWPRVKFRSLHWYILFSSRWDYACLYFIIRFIISFSFSISFIICFRKFWCVSEGFIADSVSRARQIAVRRARWRLRDIIYHLVLYLSRRRFEAWHSPFPCKAFSFMPNVTASRQPGCMRLPSLIRKPLSLMIFVLIFIKRRFWYYIGAYFTLSFSIFRAGESFASLHFRMPDISHSETWSSFIDFRHI